MKRFLLTAALIFNCGQTLNGQILDGKKSESHTDQIQLLIDRIDAVEARLERLKNAINLDSSRSNGIILMHEIDANSLIVFQTEIRDWCREPKLEINVDKNKNAIVFKNFESSTAATITKINAWIRNSPAGKLKKRTATGNLMP